MELVTIHSKNAKAFHVLCEEAFRLLFTMIMSDKKTAFWFGTDSTGNISLYINSADFCQSIEKYAFSDKTENIVNVHQVYMNKYGNQAKEFWG